MSTKNTKEKFEAGDERVVKKFALFPIKLNNTTKWLKICYILQIRLEGMFFDFWYNRGFVTVEEYEEHKKR